MIKYWLDLYGNEFTLYGDEFTLYDMDKNEIAAGRLSDIGIKDNTPDWQNILDIYFENEYGIKPEMWEIG